MIPKKIHYCWFGGKDLPELAMHCIESWEKYCPDYEIIRWDESNTNLEENNYIKEAYNAKKWAFVSDYVRLNALYNYGGIYMDTDIELIDSLDNFVELEAFSGFENSTKIQTGIMGTIKEQPFFKTLLSYYSNKHFIKNNGEFDLTTNVQIITDIAIKNGFVPNNSFQQVCGITFYPQDFFCPKDYSTGIVNLTHNTVCIHHFDGSWHSADEKKLIIIQQKYVKVFGKRIGGVIFRIHKNLTHPALIVKKLHRLSSKKANRM